MVNTNTNDNKWGNTTTTTNCCCCQLQPQQLLPMLTTTTNDMTDEWQGLRHICVLSSKFLLIDYIYNEWPSPHKTMITMGPETCLKPLVCFFVSFLWSINIKLQLDYVHYHYLSSRGLRHDMSQAPWYVSFFYTFTNIYLQVGYVHVYNNSSALPQLSTKRGCLSPGMSFLFVFIFIY